MRQVVKWGEALSAKALALYDNKTLMHTLFTAVAKRKKGRTATSKGERHLLPKCALRNLHRMLRTNTLSQTATYSHEYISAIGNRNSAKSGGITHAQKCWTAEGHTNTAMVAEKTDQRHAWTQHALNGRSEGHVEMLQTYYNLKYF